MDAIEFLNKFKNKFISLVVIIVALSVSANIYKNQAQKTAVLAQEKDMEMKKNAALEEINKYEKQLTAYKEILNKKEQVSIITNIGEIAKKSGVKIESIKPQEEKPFGTSFKRLQLDITVTSLSYHSIAKFINNIESYPDIFIISGIALHSEIAQIEGQVVNRLAADLKLSTFKIEN